MKNSDVVAFLEWLKKQNIELRLEVQTPNGVKWLPTFKSADELYCEYKAMKR